VLEAIKEPDSQQTFELQCEVRRSIATPEILHDNLELLGDLGDFLMIKE
jgi:hypothetical protein